MKCRKTRNIIFIAIWILAFALVNYPIGALASTKLTPVIFGLPFSVFYFWTAYSVLVIAGVLLAWKVMRD
ncbi:MAG: hypothetical protein IKV47_02135 [Oscillospiraceae bacterium]|nr:hypothetical protein [Oscillospiraceae bacterium]